MSVLDIVNPCHKEYEDTQDSDLYALQCFLHNSVDNYLNLFNEFAVLPLPVEKNKDV